MVSLGGPKIELPRPKHCAAPLRARVHVTEIGRSSKECGLRHLPTADELSFVGRRSAKIANRGSDRQVEWFLVDDGPGPYFGDAVEGLIVCDTLRCSDTADMLSLSELKTQNYFESPILSVGSE